MKLLSLLTTILILSFTTGNKNKTQEKEYTGKATLNEWQIILANPDDVPLNQRKAVIAKFVGQLQTQINDTIPKKK